MAAYFIILGQAHAVQARAGPSHHQPQAVTRPQPVPAGRIIGKAGLRHIVNTYRTGTAVFYHRDK